MQYLAWRGIFHWRQNNAPVFDPRRGCYRAHNGIKGLPDIAGVLKGGRAFYIEVKAQSGKVSESQQAFIDRVTELGGLAIVARSVNDVSAILDKLEK